MSETSSKFPAALQVGQDPSADKTELRVDQPVISTQGERFRDRDEHIMEGLLDGATAPFDLNVNNVTIAGNLTVTGAMDFAEKLLIFSNI